MTGYLHLTGLTLVILSMAHLVFPGYFKWKTELQHISLINQQLMQVHTFFIALVVLLMGILCICCAEDLLNTRLGRYISLGLFIFWGMRLFFQFFVYASVHWKGKRFETCVHIILSLYWTCLTLIFLLIYLR